MWQNFPCQTWHRKSYKTQTQVVGNFWSTYGILLILLLMISINVRINKSINDIWGCHYWFNLNFACRSTLYRPRTGWARCGTRLCGLTRPSRSSTLWAPASGCTWPTPATTSSTTTATGEKNSKELSSKNTVIFGHCDTMGNCKSVTLTDLSQLFGNVQ